MSLMRFFFVKKDKNFSFLMPVYTVTPPLNVNGNVSNCEELFQWLLHVCYFVSTMKYNIRIQNNVNFQLDCTVCYDGDFGLCESHELSFAILTDKEK